MSTAAPDDDDEASELVNGWCCGDLSPLVRFVERCQCRLEQKARLLRPTPPITIARATRPLNNPDLKPKMTNGSPQAIQTRLPLSKPILAPDHPSLSGRFRWVCVFDSSFAWSMSDME